MRDLKMTPFARSTGWIREYRWQIVIYLWLICFLNYVDRSAIFTLLPLVGRDLSMTGTELGLIGSVFLWVYSIASPFAGALGDRFARKNVILAGLAIWSVVTALTALSHSSSQLLFYRALMGLAEAAYFPAALALLSDYHGQKSSSTAVSIHQSAIYVGYLGGGSLAGIIGQVYGWKPPFLLFGCAGLISVVLFSFLLKEAPQSQAAARSKKSGKLNLLQTAREIYSCPTAVALALAHFGILSVAWIIFAWAPFYIHERFSLTLAQAAVHSTLSLQIPSIFGILAGGLMADRLMRRTRHGRMATLIAGLLCGAPFLMMLGWGTSQALALVGLAGFGFFKGFFDGNGPPAIYDVVHPRSRSSVYGMFNAIAGVSSGFGVLLVGVFKDILGLGNMLALLAVLYFAGAAVLWFASRRTLVSDVLLLQERLSKEDQETSLALLQMSGGTPENADSRR
jgi:MFS family permease